MNQLAQLPVSERMELVQQLWDSIGQSQDELPIQSWQRELAKARLADMQGHESERGLTREEVWQQVDQQRGK